MPNRRKEEEGEGREEKQLETPWKLIKEKRGESYISNTKQAYMYPDDKELMEYERKGSSCY